jgi:IS1 family transposase/transposase-like protein
MICPECDSEHIVKNGVKENGKQNHLCRICDRQFVETPSDHYRISEETRALVDRLLLEKIPLAGIARAAQVSERWLQYYVNNLYDNVPRKLTVLPKKKGHLTVECDEMWSFVGNKDNKQWIWLAIDRDTREIIGVHVGDRSRRGAQALWNSLPPVYRQCAVCFTDFWDAYNKVIPVKRHKAVGKETGLTNHIERFNNTMRQRISRLVRDTLSFSKKIENHIGAIWNFVHHYNASLALS